MKYERLNYAIAASGNCLYSIDLASDAGTLLGSIGSDTGSDLISHISSALLLSLSLL